MESFETTETSTTSTGDVWTDNLEKPQYIFLKKDVVMSQRL